MSEKEEKKRKDKNTSIQLGHVIVIVNVNVKQKADKKILLGTVCNEGVNQTEPFLINHIYSEFNSVSCQSVFYVTHTRGRETSI